MSRLGDIKPVKLRSLGGTKKYGVAARNLEELLDKGCKLLQKPRRLSRVCRSEDGARVTDGSFHSLPGDAELLLLSRDEAWDGFSTDIGRLLSGDRTSGLLVEAARSLLLGEPSAKRRRLLGDLLLSLEDRSEAESRDDDLGWFEGLDSRFKTKSAYMKYNCESRIRGYVKELETATKSIQKPRMKDQFTKEAGHLKDLLKADKYNGSYFDRSEEKERRLCTAQGWFTCQGAFDQDVCKSLHSINPYSNRENRIIFSTWNLDHRIEKKRTVIPALVDAVQKRQRAVINLPYFYRLLFTRDNLKLVHIVCHKKVPHLLHCDPDQVYQRAAGEDTPRAVGKKKKRRRIRYKC